MRVAGAEAAEDDAALVGLAVTVRVAEVKKFRAAVHVEPAVAEFEAGGHEQVIGEYGSLVGATVAVGVLQHDDLVVGFLARLELRIDDAAADPEAAVGIEAKLDG